MTKLATRIAMGFAQAAILPFTLWRSKSRHTGREWAMHWGLICSVVIALTWLNRFWELDKAVQFPSPHLRNAWLPLMFLLGYSLLWAAYGVWRSINRPDAVSPFPDLDDCWNQALRSLEHAGRPLGSLPTVMLLGHSHQSEHKTLAALHSSSTIGPFPMHRSAPVRVFADDHAIYLSCPDASLASHFSGVIERAAEHRELHRPSIAPAAGPRPMGPSLAAAANETDRSRSDVNSELELAESRLALAIDEAASWDEVFGNDESDESFESESISERPLTRAEQQTRLARLRHVAALLRHQCEPYLSLHGVVLFVPLAAAERAEDVDQMAIAIRQELDAVADASGATAPLMIVATGLERLPGCRTLLSSLPTERRQRRFGSQCRVAEPITDDSLARRISWACDELASVVSYRLFRTDDASTLDAGRSRAASTSAPDSRRANADLFQFAQSLRRRRPHLVRMLQRGLLACGTPWRLRGCFFVATGEEANLRGFASQILPRISEWRHEAGWTASAIHRDARLTRLAYATYIGAAAIALIGVWLVASL
ncbi:MAG: hypothetical protein KDA61_13715 [Planctomycetales bacterium]|nr:hypothetical protein [Planctomycetales bacterium]